MRIELMAFVTGAALACVIAPSVAQNTVVPVTIDNFVFEPGAADGQGRDDRDLDQP